MSATTRTQLVAYLIAAALLLAGGIYVLSAGAGAGRGQGGGAAAGGVALDGAEVNGPTSSGSASGSRTPATGAALYVHVAGAVRRPGMYRVPAGSRVATAVRRAGGLSRRADLTAFNLASTVRDAQQVIVPARGEARGGAAAAAQTGAPSAGAPTAGASPGGSPRAIPLSSATPEQLDTLDGIGPKLAAAIIAYRDRKGGFKSVDELREVGGIGEKRFAALRKAVRP